MPTDAEIAEARSALVAYWRQHPLAADDAEGIRRFWLAGTSSADAVDAALRELVRDGYAAAVRRPDGREWYRRNS